MSQQKYTQLSENERIVIEGMLDGGYGVSAIALTLNRHPSTISLELDRNQEYPKKLRVNKPRELGMDSRHFRGTTKVDEIRNKKDGFKKRLRAFNRPNYSAKSAQKKTKKRCKKQLLVLERQEYEQTKEYILKHLKLRWSPEQISGRLDIETTEGLLYVSAKAIRKYTKKYDLTKHLRRRGKKYHYTQAQNVATTDTNKRSIVDRSVVVEELGRLGDLEGDTIFGKDSRDRLLTHSERKTGMVLIGLVKGYNVQRIQKQTILDLDRLAQQTGIRPKTITYDNGVEFAGWKQTEKESRVDIYFANPYHSWERGRNENTNGLIRDFFPKGTDFKKLTKQDILDIESKLNNRPRKRFQWLTPLEYARSLSVAVEG